MVPGGGGGGGEGRGKLTNPPSPPLFFEMGGGVGVGWVVGFGG